MRLYRFTAVVLLVWILVAAGDLIYEERQESRQAYELALHDARARIDRERALRFFASAVGGVYVPLSDQIQPNPHMAHIPERDIVTPSGKKLTLLNPANLQRLVSKVSANVSALQTKVTSLRLLNPDNAPDAWEEEALKSFARGETERRKVSVVAGEKQLRLMQPLHIEKGCLKCHSEQGYQEGELRGGISIVVSMAPYQALEEQADRVLDLSHGFVWTLVSGVILVVAWRSRRRLLGHIQAEQELRASKKAIAAALQDRELLLREIHHRVKGNLQIVSSLLRIQSRGENACVVKVLGESERRIQSMAKLHEKLCQADDLRHIDTHAYLVSILEELQGAQASAPDRYRYNVLFEQIDLSVDRAMLAGQIFSELLSNIFKHAFPDGQGGTIDLLLRRTLSGKVEMVVADDGTGLPADFNHSKIESFGWQLVNGLAAKLGASIKVELVNGTSVRLLFDQSGQETEI